MPHIHEKIDYTSEVFVVHDNRVLLRMHDKYKFWSSVGGHIELDEDPTQAAVREVKEEVGLDIKLVGDIAEYGPLNESFRELPVPRFLNRHHISDTHEHITFVYFATSDTANVVAGGDDRSDEWKWFSAEDLEDAKYALRPNVKFYANRALTERMETGLDL